MKRLPPNIVVMLAGIALASFATLLHARWKAAGAPDLTSAQWDQSCAWWEQGRCTECHNAAGGEAQPRPEYHTDAFCRHTHGRDHDIPPQRCFTCHRQENCEACHNTRPESHTSDFCKPIGGAGSRQHALSARLRPSACLVCHRSPAEDCAPCHTSAELAPWRARALEDLGLWADIFRLRSAEDRP